MNVQALRQKLAQQEKLILLDVREVEELEESPLVYASPSASFLNIPLPILLTLPKDELHERIFRSSGVPDTTLVVVTCRSGGRSARACDYMKLFGWTIENMDGGVMAWQEHL